MLGFKNCSLTSHLNFLKNGAVSFGRRTSERALNTLCVTYLYEAAFLALVVIKSECGSVLKSVKHVLHHTDHTESNDQPRSCLCIKINHIELISIQLSFGI